MDSLDQTWVALRGIFESQIRLHILVPLAPAEKTMYNDDKYQIILSP